jgi:hypothetical protein
MIKWWSHFILRWFTLAGQRDAAINLKFREIDKVRLNIIVRAYHERWVLRIHIWIPQTRWSISLIHLNVYEKRILQGLLVLFEPFMGKTLLCIVPQ